MPSLFRASEICFAVETENSVYLLTFRAEPLRQMPHAFAAVTGSRHRKN